MRTPSTPLFSTTRIQFFCFSHLAARTPFLLGTYCWRQTVTLRGYLPKLLLPLGRRYQQQFCTWPFLSNISWLSPWDINWVGVIASLKVWHFFFFFYELTPRQVRLQLKAHFPNFCSLHLPTRLYPPPPPPTKKKLKRCPSLTHVQQHISSIQLGGLILATSQNQVNQLFFLAGRSQVHSLSGNAQVLQIPSTCEIGYFIPFHCTLVSVRVRKHQPFLTSPRWTPWWVEP